MAIQIYDPTTEASTRRIAYASRPGTLESALGPSTTQQSRPVAASLAAILEREYNAKST